MIVKKHVNEGRLILAVCDSDILGKKFEDEICVLDLSSKFYDGDETEKEKVQELMLQAYIVNLAGKKSLAVAQELDLLDEIGIIYVEGIPHAQLLVIREK